MLGADALFAFNWQIALHGEPLTEEEMDQLAGAASPMLKLRGSWTVIDPAIARKARKRLVRTVKPAQAVAAALTGVVQVDPTGDGPEEDVPVVVGATLLKVREQLRDRRRPASRSRRRRGCGRRCATTSATASPGSPS